MEKICQTNENDFFFKSLKMGSNFPDFRFGSLYSVRFRYIYFGNNFWESMSRLTWKVNWDRQMWAFYMGQFLSCDCFLFNENYQCCSEFETQRIFEVNLGLPKFPIAFSLSNIGNSSCFSSEIVNLFFNVSVLSCLKKLLYQVEHVH